jgi:hypothetical protein
MTCRLRRIAVTQARTIRNSGKATTTANHGLFSPASKPTEMGVRRKKFNTRGRD